MNRAGLLLGVVYLAIALTGCSAETAQLSAADPFATVAQQADQAYAQGITLYQQGRVKEALDAFKRARLLSPTDDTRIDDMIQRATLELTPTPTAAPSTATPTAEPTPVVQSSATPSAELGTVYFGQVFLSVVPGRDGAPAPMAQFSHQDQIGLYIELLDQRLRMSFAVRVFDADTGRLVKDARSDALHRFPGKLVWYHEGVESQGHYRAELLYSDDSGGVADVLTHVFEYVVGTTPVPIPTPMPIASPTSLPVPTPMPIPMPMPPPVSEPSNPTVRLAVATPPPVAVQPTSTPHPLPTSVSATTLLVIAGPAALDVVDPLDQLIIADRSGLVWSLDHGQPSLKRPFSVSGDPVGLAADAANNRLYVAVRGQPAVVALDATSGKQLASTPLSGDPGDVRLDSALGLLHVLVPERDLLETIDVATFKVVRSTPGLAQVTGISLDTETHTVYLSHLGGQLSVVEGQTGSVLRRVGLSAEGLAGVVAAHGRVFGINTPGRELLEVDPSMTGVSHLALAAEPVCIVVGPQTGLVYVLDAASNAIVRLDPATGAELGRVQVADDGAAISSQLLPDALWLRPRMVVSSADERVYLIEPDGATLALLPPQL